MAFYLVRAGRPEDAWEIWRELSDRQALAAQNIRDELEGLLGPAGESLLTDEAFADRIRSVLDTLNGAAE